MMIRNGEEEDADERGGGEPHHHVVLERALADPEHRLEHDRQHRGLETKEQRDDHRHLAIAGVDVAERHDGDDAGDDEQHAGHDAAERAVHQPADIGRELLRLRAGQQHAVVERMQEPLFRDPVLFLDDDPMHDRDLAGRPAEAQAGDPQPDAERLPQRHAVMRDRFGLCGYRKLGHDLTGAFS
jgi:hypothetical protein